MGFGVLEVRASSLSDAPDCTRRMMGKVLPAASEFGYRLNEGIHNVASLMGTALHYYAEGAEGETADDWIERASGGKPIAWDNKTPSRDWARSQLREMAEEFDAHLGRNWREDGAILEKRLSGRFSIDGTDFLLTGHPDKLGKDGVVHDLKTGRKGEHRHGAQLGGYIRLAEQAKLFERGEAKEAVIHFIPRDMSGVLDERYSRDDCVQQARNSMRLISRAAQDFGRSGDPADIPANPMSQMCSETYCGAWGTPWCKMTMKRGRK